MKEEIKMAKHFVECILDNRGNCTEEGMRQMLMIQNDNKLLLEHLKALRNIINVAIDDLEQVKEKTK